MRCPSCEKFVSYDTEADPEPEDLTFSGDKFNVDVRRVLNCQDCGTELKDAQLSIEGDVVESDTKAEKPCEDGHEWETDSDPDYSTTERTQTEDRHGKKITNSRYAKHYYGVKVEADVTCSECGQTGTIEGEAEEQASGFEEC